MNAAAHTPMLWIGGDRVDPGDAQVSALDRGFTLGDALFETVRLYRGSAFRLERHLERLERGAQRLRLPVPPHLRRWIRDAVHDAGQAGLADASLRLTLSRGVAPPGLAASGTAMPTCAIVIQPLPVLAPLRDRGLSARTVAARRNEYAATAGLKTTSYVESIVALADALAAGADEALLLDTAGHLCEASASNIFLIRAGTLVTAPLSCGILPGITRQAVLEIAGAMRLAVEERPVAPHELHEANEAFLTSSIREIAPLVRADDRDIGAGDVGPITQRIIEAFADLVSGECP